MMVIVFGLVVSIFILSIGFYVAKKMRTSPASRLFPARTVTKVHEEKSRFLIPQEVAQKLQNYLGLAKNPVKLRELKKKLMMAGLYDDRWGVILTAAKVVLPILFTLVSLPFILNLKMGAAFRVIIVYAPLAIGFYFPSFILSHIISSRQQKITESLPDALDLLVVCVEAGLGLNAAVKRVADEFQHTNPILSQEFSLLNLEINAGMEREQALRNLAERTGVEDLASLCAILIQADRFGTSVATALRVQSDTMRTNRRQKLEEKAAKTPVKLVFPLILFIFPALVMVVLGPAVIQLSESFLKK